MILKDITVDELIEQLKKLDGSKKIKAVQADELGDYWADDEILIESVEHCTTSIIRENGRLDIYDNIQNKDGDFYVIGDVGAKRKEHDQRKVGDNKC